MEGCYTSGEFAKKAKVSTRTIRYYDKQDLLKPSFISEAGYRLYTDADFAKLQKILSLKYLGFSLDEIRSITINDRDGDYVKKSLKLQQKLIKKRMEQLQAVEQTLGETLEYLEDTPAVDWNRMLHLIHIINMEKTLVRQYKNAANIKIRIDLHKQYSQNPLTWFQWIYQQLDIKDYQRILELGCGSGELWRVNETCLPRHAQICLSDISEGMLEDAKEHLQKVSFPFTYAAADCQDIPAPNQTFQKITANYVLFYLKDLDRALEEIRRVLTEDGTFFCTTYGAAHMKEISQLVKEFDSRITLSDVELHEVFGLENGNKILKKHFFQVEQVLYEDQLKVDDAGPLMEYILSCHGNQQEYLSGSYEAFRSFLQKKIQKKGYITITKQAGGFLCRKKTGGTAL